MISSHRLLGIALLVGGILVGLVIVVVLGSYREVWGTAVTIAATLIALALLVLPQVVLGIYLITRRPPDEPQFPPDHP